VGYGSKEVVEHGRYLDAALVSRVYRNGTAEAIEAVSALDNVLFPISVLTRCSAMQLSPMY
jgi:hypothetical protein